MACPMFLLCNAYFDGRGGDGESYGGIPQRREIHPARQADHRISGKFQAFGRDNKENILASAVEARNPTLFAITLRRLMRYSIRNRKSLQSQKRRHYAMRPERPNRKRQSVMRGPNGRRSTSKSRRRQTTSPKSPGIMARSIIPPCKSTSTQAIYRPCRPRPRKSRRPSSPPRKRSRLSPTLSPMFTRGISNSRWQNCKGYMMPSIEDRGLVGSIPRTAGEKAAFRGL